MSHSKVGQVASDTSFMQEVIRMAVANVRQGGGPFAALVVRQGEIIGRGVNQVTSLHDPTAHAEVQAIRAACREIQSHELTGCEVYASCEPCPMCLAALYWARPKEVFFAATKHDAALAGFDDAYIYEELSGDPSSRKLKMSRLELDGVLEPFRAWKAKVDKIAY